MLYSYFVKLHVWLEKLMVLQILISGWDSSWPLDWKELVQLDNLRALRVEGYLFSSTCSQVPVDGAPCLASLAQVYRLVWRLQTAFMKWTNTASVVCWFFYCLHFRWLMKLPCRVRSSFLKGTKFSLPLNSGVLSCRSVFRCS